MGTILVTSWSYKMVLKSNLLTFKPSLNKSRERQFGNRTFMLPIILETNRRRPRQSTGNRLLGIPSMVQSTPSFHGALVSYNATSDPVAPETRWHFQIWERKREAGARLLPWSIFYDSKGIHLKLPSVVVTFPEATVTFPGNRTTKISNSPSSWSWH